jgi:A/G-specific adenine glycosylase
MLQQTPVARVESFYPGFLARFPTVRALAAARPSVVREHWDGLGYYRRAANLHRLAREVVQDHEGVIPRDVEVLRDLPGVGRYTAGAVACFAFEQPVPAIDTNVARVLRRAFHPRLGRDARAARALLATATRLQPRRGSEAWALNQGLMELGARICTARIARCEVCPVRMECATGSKR